MSISLQYKKKLKKHQNIKDLKFQENKASRIIFHSSSFFPIVLRSKKCNRKCRGSFSLIGKQNLQNVSKMWLLVSQAKNEKLWARSASYWWYDIISKYRKFKTFRPKPREIKNLERKPQTNMLNLLLWQE